MTLTVKLSLLIAIGLAVTILIFLQPTDKDALSGVFSDNTETLKAHKDYGIKRTLVWLTFISIFTIIALCYMW